MITRGKDDDDENPKSRIQITKKAPNSTLQAPKKHQTSNIE
jgi:hypothetical protein